MYFKTTKRTVEHLIREGRVHLRTTGVDEAQTVLATLTELSTREDAASQIAAALIQGLAEACSFYESELTEWREIQERCISDTTEPMTKTRIIVTTVPQPGLVM